MKDCFSEIEFDIISFSSEDSVIAASPVVTPDPWIPGEGED